MEKKKIILSIEKQNEITDLQHTLIDILDQLNLNLEESNQVQHKQKIIHSCYWINRLLKSTFEK